MSKAVGEREEQAVVGDTRKFMRVPHGQAGHAADTDKRDIIERVRVALAQLVGPDNQRVV